MAAFNLFIDIGNDAFQPEPSHELARLLRKLADDFTEDGQVAELGTILDVNGARVGQYVIVGSS